MVGEISEPEQEGVTEAEVEAEPEVLIGNPELQGEGGETRVSYENLGDGNEHSDRIDMLGVDASTEISMKASLEEINENIDFAANAIDGILGSIETLADEVDSKDFDDLFSEEVVTARPRVAGNAEMSLEFEDDADSHESDSSRTTAKGRVILSTVWGALRNFAGIKSNKSDKE